ncbi:hypothetical protein D3C74_181370 [compost metagenome]
MLYSTIISRKKLKDSCSDPDSTWQSTEEIRETPESYYQPAVELLDTILKKHPEL